MAAAAPRSLSDLPDDLLRRILFFTPAREAASTSVLSRRWRSLWRFSGAINLDSRSFTSSHDEPAEEHHYHPSWESGNAYGSRCRYSPKAREAFLRGAAEAFAAAAVPVTRLTVVVEEGSRIDPTCGEDLVAAVVSHPKARRVEELHLRVEVVQWSYTLSFGDLSSEALRVLRLRVANCHYATLSAPLPGAVFPRLSELHVRGCTLPLADLRRIAAAAPQLAALHLDSCYLSPEAPNLGGAPSEDEIPSGRCRLTFPRLSELHLRKCTVPPTDLAHIAAAAPRLAALHLDSCYLSPGPAILGWQLPEDEMPSGCCRLTLPAVTALVLADCSFQRDESSLELDVPRLRYFKYEGSVQRSHHLSLKPLPPSNLAQVDLNFNKYDYHYHHHADGEARKTFWRFIQNFRNARVLKLRMDFAMDPIAITDKDDELLGTLLFHLLERLEVEAQYVPGGETSMAALLGNLLHCCPVVRDLRLKLSKDLRSRTRNSIDKEAWADFARSVDRFRRRHRSPPMHCSSDQDDREAPYMIPELSHEFFRCLRSYLRRVSLQFCMEEPNCLGVQLAKFFAENAAVLEEMRIDDGSQRMREHTNDSVRRWIKTRNLAGVAVLPG